MDMIFIRTQSGIKPCMRFGMYRDDVFNGDIIGKQGV
jgi:hypothetical protein